MGSSAIREKFMIHTLKEWWTWYWMSEFSHASIEVPLVETTILLLALTICLFFRLSRTGLMLAFLFLYRWGWMIQIQRFTPDPGIQAIFSAAYLMFGFIIFTFSIVSILHHRHDGV